MPDKSSQRSSSSDAFYKQFEQYMHELKELGITPSEIKKNVEEPLKACSSRQIYLNLNSMLYRDPMTAMAATGVYSFDSVEEIQNIQQACIDEIERDNTMGCCCKIGMG